MLSRTKPGRWAPFVLAASLLALPGTVACRKGSESPASTFNPLTLPLHGTHGCNGTAQTFTPPQTPTAVGLTLPVLGPSSQLAGVQGEDVLYVTTLAAEIYALDFSGGSPPTEAELVGPGEVAALLGTAGIATAPELSGIAVFDASTLLVVEHTSNTILAVDRTTGDVTFFVGLPEETPGFADGVGSSSRFSFTAPTQIVPTGNGLVFVADPGNHAIRQIEPTTIPDVWIVSTLAGSGSPGHADTSIGSSAFDTPVGLSVACNGSLYVTETGAEGFGGHRLRAMFIGDRTFFGLLGSVTTLAGDGTDATGEGIGGMATLAAPVSLASTGDGDVYFVDSATGILRRHVAGTGVTDCPLWTDCATALGALPFFTPGGTFSVVLSDTDVLYVLDGIAGVLWRVTP